MQQHIYHSDVGGKPAICFNTCLDPRAFARTKMSQSLIEPGYIVQPDGSHEVWKAAGVHDLNGSMRVWGMSFSGKRLDVLINEVNSTGQQTEALQTALQAIVFWIRAKMLLGETNTTLNPGAVFVCLENTNENKFPKGSVFFTPKYLSNRCLLMEGSLPGGSGEIDRYNCPDLTGMDAAAFCAGAMLYKILSKSLPYPNDKTIFQDMREGIFLPPHLAVPGLDKKICNLIQAAFMLPVTNRAIYKSGTDIISSLLNIFLDNENNIVSVSSMINNLPKEEHARIEKERKRHLFRQNTLAKTRRFITNNKHALIGITAGILFILFIIASTSKSFKNRPTTEGMDSDTVIMAYYDAFSSLDHVLMEACVQGADKTDINAAATLYAIYRTRESYERSSSAHIVPAKVWRDAGGELPAPNAFGVTDLSIRYLAGSYEDNMIMYRADYLLWSPDADYVITRSDTITLKRDRKNNWRITEILRDEK